MNKDMKLKNGDVLYFKWGHTSDKVIVNSFDGKTIEEVESSHTDYVIEKVERLITMYERKEILDGKEKEYLSAVIRPFKSRIKYICNTKMYDREYINIVTYGISSRANDSMPFPLFKKGTMYKGMELDKEYTLKELGLE